jgi:hypothetical protein
MLKSFDPRLVDVAARFLRGLTAVAQGVSHEASVACHRAAGAAAGAQGDAGRTGNLANVVEKEEEEGSGDESEDEDAALEAAGAFAAMMSASASALVGACVDESLTQLLLQRLRTAVSDAQVLVMPPAAAANSGGSSSSSSGSIAASGGMGAKLTIKAAAQATTATMFMKGETPLKKPTVLP